jgi:hypothetical protein
MIRNDVDAIESPPAEDDPRVLRAVEEYLAARQAGAAPDRHRFLARHADIAAALADCLDGLDFIQQAGIQKPEPTRTRKVGEYPLQGTGFFGSARHGRFRPE